jgi:hypothetical protein
VDSTATGFDTRRRSFAFRDGSSQPSPQLQSHRADAIPRRDYRRFIVACAIPVSIMEAMAAGIPALATDVGGNTKIVDKETGHVLPVEITAGTLAKACRSCVTCLCNASVICAPTTAVDRTRIRSGPERARRGAGAARPWIKRSSTRMLLVYLTHISSQSRRSTGGRRSLSARFSRQSIACLPDSTYSMQHCPLTCLSSAYFEFFK